MRNKLLMRRLDFLDKLGGLPEPEVINEEWLYILKEETRNSILIEGVFISEDELEDVLSKGTPIKKNQQEALNYFRTAKYFYEMAYQNHKTGEFMFSLAMMRQINKMLYEGIKTAGEYRKGDVKIIGAKIIPPSPHDIGKWLTFHRQYIEEAMNSEGLIRAVSAQHILFEATHPFDDCNGRTGRIILNYLLLSKGRPPVILKGDETNKKRYYLALEQGDKTLRTLTREEFDKDKTKAAAGLMKTERMEALLNEALRMSLDRVLVRLVETKKGIKVRPAKEVADSLNYAPDSMRTLISRGKFIAVKRGKEWYTHEELQITNGN